MFEKSYIVRIFCFDSEWQCNELHSFAGQKHVKNDAQIPCFNINFLQISTLFCTLILWAFLPFICKLRILSGQNFFFFLCKRTTITALGGLSFIFYITISAKPLWPSGIFFVLNYFVFKWYVPIAFSSPRTQPKVVLFLVSNESLYFSKYFNSKISASNSLYFGSYSRKCTYFWYTNFWFCVLS